MDDTLSILRKWVLHDAAGKPHEIKLTRPADGKILANYQNHNTPPGWHELDPQTNAPISRFALRATVDQTPHGNTIVVDAVRRHATTRILTKDGRK